MFERQKIRRFMKRRCLNSPMSVFKTPHEDICVEARQCLNIADRAESTGHVRLPVQLSRRLHRLRHDDQPHHTSQALRTQERRVPDAGPRTSSRLDCLRVLRQTCK